MKSILPTIDFEGKKVKPRRGYYYCPYDCSDPRYPERKWKTEKGFRKHMEKCPSCPSAELREAQEKKQREEANEIKGKEAIASITQKIGDKVYYVHKYIVKPTHEWRRSRKVHVRYDAVIKYSAETAIIDSISYNGYTVVFNDHITVKSLCDTLQEAEQKAIEAQKSYDESVRQAKMCR